MDTSDPSHWNKTVVIDSTICGLIRKKTLPDKYTGSPLDEENALCETFRLAEVYSIVNPGNTPTEDIKLALNTMRKQGFKVASRMSELKNSVDLGSP